MGPSMPPPGSGDPGPRVPGPLDVSATVRAAIALYRADMIKLWQAIALVAIPLQALAFLLRAASIPGGSILQNSRIYVPPGTGGGYAATSSLSSLLSALILLLSIGAAYRILLGRHLHHPADLFTSFSFALDRVLPLLWLSILNGVVVLVGFLCLIVPGIYLIVAFSIAVPVLMAEDARGSRALGRSRQLLGGHWWHVAGCLILTAIIVGIGEILIGLLTGPITSALSPHSVTGFLLIDGVITALVSILFSPLTAAIAVVLYVDMLVRTRDPQLARLLA